MKEDKTVVKSGVGFTGLLTLVLITLKLLDIIKWSWIWVLSPLWISTGLSVGLIVIFILIIKRR